MAKYHNAYAEIKLKNKIIIVPHIVVRVSQKNYFEFVKFINDDLPESIFYEDLIAKAIIFKTMK